MDPTANLREQLEITNRINHDKALEGDAERLAELVDVLHWWISHKRGALPEQWQR